MKKDNNILNQLNKNNQPNVPEGFFDNFADDLMSKIESDKSILDTINKTEKPKVPTSFFDDFADNLPVENKKKARVISLKTITIVSSIAASLLLIFMLSWESNTNQQLASEENNTQIDSTIEDSSYQIHTDEDYLAYLTEDDIVEYIIENKVDIDEDDIYSFDEDDEMFDELDSELDDYIYEL